MKKMQDAIDFAIDQEQQAVELYTFLHAKSADPKAREVFAELREMEEQHKKNLQDFDQSAFVQRHANHPLLDLKLTDYMLEKEVDDTLTFQDALILAAQREGKAYQMYLDLAAEAAYDPALQELFNMLAREEQLHKDQVEALYDDTILSQN